MPGPHTPARNHLLAALSPDVQGRLFPDLELVELPLGKALYESGDALRHVHFPTDSAWESAHHDPGADRQHARRAARGFTDAAGKLQKLGVIEYNRGQITVLDRPGLERLSCECHAVVKKETDRLLPYLPPHAAP